jgi:hypothetical protein
VSDDDNPRLVTLMFEPGELQLLMGLLATDIDTMQNNVELAQSEQMRTVLKARVVLAMSLHTAVSEAFYSVAPSFTCPRCGTVSYNATDVVLGYCSKCDENTGDLDSAEETAALLADPDAMATLRVSEAEIDAGQAVPFEDYLRDQT